MTTHKLSIYYDGHCPFCSNYTKLLRLRDAVGIVELVDLRQHDSLRKKLQTLGFDLDEGMVAMHNGKYYHGAECVEYLAALSTPSNIFNRLNKCILGNHMTATVIYPILRAGRNLTLRLLGKEKFG